MKLIPGKTYVVNHLSWVGSRHVTRGVYLHTAVESSRKGMFSFVDLIFYDFHKYVIVSTKFIDYITQDLSENVDEERLLMEFMRVRCT